MVNKEYYQIDASINPKIIGKSEFQLTVQINDKVFLEQSKKYFFVENYFKYLKSLYENFPKKLVGKMYQRKRNPIDIMNVRPYYMSLQFAISKKVKGIFDNLNIDKSEFHLEEIHIEGSEEKFFLLFIPILKDSEYVDYSKSIYYDSLNGKYAVFGSYEKYAEGKKRGNYSVKKLYIAPELQKRDIISLQAGGPFYSQRIIEAFPENQVLGYYIIKGGDFKVDLHFGTD